MIGSRLQIRDATAADLPAIVEIYNASIPQRMATADLFPVSVDSRRDWFDAHTPYHRPLWVAVTDLQPVAGWLSFSSFYGRPAYEATAEIGIYVHPECQRQGVGRTLLARAVAEGSLFDLRTLLAYIFAHNTRSLSLFEQAGFSEWGYLPCVAELDGVERDLAILGKRLQSC
ncbi:MAG: GNAT family N-acetyltransferase [Geitlerinemataceae cyanobacterium]